MPSLGALAELELAPLSQAEPVGSGLQEGTLAVDWTASGNTGPSSLANSSSPPRKGEPAYIGPAAGEILWCCCQCGGGPWLLANVVACISCNHPFCEHCGTC